MYLINNLDYNNNNYNIEWYRLGERAWVNNWFSNMTMLPFSLVWEGREYPSVEHAYQASKFITPDYIEFIRDAQSGAQAKKRARGIPMEVIDFDHKKVNIMWCLNAQKWVHPVCRHMLFSHDIDKPLVEFNNWGDQFWGVEIKTYGAVVGGENYLGRIITSIRNQLKNNIDDPKFIPIMPHDL